SGEHLLEVAHVPIPASPRRIVDGPEHTCRNDVLVVRAVEHAQPPARWTRGVHAPQVVVLQLDVRRRLERRHRAALWVQTTERAADRAVLPGAVDPVQHEQNPASRFPPEPLVEPPELVEQFGMLLPRRLLVSKAEATAGRPPVEAGESAGSNL